jgi:hypothetical protein
MKQCVRVLQLFGLCTLYVYKLEKHMTLKEKHYRHYVT